MKSRGQVWFKFENSEQAHEMLLETHQKNLHGASLIVRFELGMDSNGKRIVDQNSHHTIIRSVQLRKGASSQTHEGLGVSYTHRSVFCGEMEYPFPTGLYLTRIIQLTNLYPPDNPLLALLRDTSFYGNKYSKEMSECMAMADCTQRAVRMVTGYCCSIYDTVPLPPTSPVASDGGKETAMPRSVTVYVLGDGVRPLCAAALCLHIPPQFNWRFVSIDPLMETHDLNLGAYSHCLEVVKGYSQDYEISPTSSLSIVIACHSHAPVSEFWNRLSTPKVAIIMACCADYADLPGTEPISQFSDYEVYSPKREIKIYSAASPPLAVTASEDFVGSRVDDPHTASSTSTS